MANSTRRLKKELKWWKTEGEEEIEYGNAKLISPDDLFKWEIIVMGPEGTPYEDGIFYVNCTCPEGYPMKPPKVLSRRTVFLFVFSERHCSS